VRSEVAFLDHDRPLDEDITAISSLIWEHAIPLPG